MHIQHKTITVLLADDHEVIREGVRHLLENANDMSVVGEAQDGKEVKELVTKLQPNILVLDLKMPSISPFELEKWVRENHPQTITLVLTAHDRDYYLSGMIDAGIAGYLDKNERGENLIAAIRRAARGEVFFTGEQMDRARKWQHNAGEIWKKLTKRQREVLILLGQGHSNKAIAEKLGITLKTVAYHVSAILDLLNVGSRNKAVAWLHKYFPDDLE